MKVLNIIWGYTLGAGIDKCFLTYDSLGTEDPDVKVKSVCINLLNLNSHIEPLVERNVKLINIKNRFDYSWLSKLTALIDDECPDVLFAHGFNGAIMMALLRLFKKVKIPFVCTYHGPYHAPTKAKKIVEPIYNGLSVYIYRKLAKHTICVENYSRKYLKGKGVENVTTVHNGIPDIEIDFKNNISAKIDKPMLVTASRITEVKGLTYLLKALSILKQRSVPFHYFMIGEGPLLDDLKAEANDLGLSDDEITFAGFRSNIPEWLSKCDLFLLPSLFEYHSIAVLEAMRSGCAIVATDVGGNSESITHNREGIIIPSKDANALADAIEFLIYDPEVRANLARNARRRFEEEFQESAMKKNIIKVLKS